MSEQKDQNQDTQPSSDTDHLSEMTLQYAGHSQVNSTDGKTQLSLFGNILRDPVSLKGKVKQPQNLREALSTIYAIVGSDYRYKPKDRTAYLAFSRMRKESKNKNAWQAQQDYFNWLLRNDPLAFLILDPVISVQPDHLMFEVFSKDEGSYANLCIDLDAFEIQGTPQCGTTNIDFSENLYTSIQQFRSYREATISIGQKDVAVEVKKKSTDTSENDSITEDELISQTLEKKIKLPDSWLRGFLQVQSAAMLPSDRFSLTPMDLYNCLYHLRMNADIKGKPRGLRVELIPGEAPRLVLEPWDVVINSTAGVYQGEQAKVVKLWGRRRLMLVKRLLPIVESIDVHISGSGLPCFWVFRCAGMTLTLGLTGFTANDWSQGCAFDLLMARKTQGSKTLDKVIKHLSSHYVDSRLNISNAIKVKDAELIEALQLGCQLGQMMYDIANDVYRLRPLTDAPLDMQRLEYRNVRERVAHDYIQRKGCVSISTENHIYGTGIEITGEVNIKEDKRDYRPQLFINDEGFVSRAECSCNHFRKNGLKSGPCEHLIALRLIFAQREIKRRQSGGQRTTVTVETRTYSRRNQQGEERVQLSLDHKLVNRRWGRSGQKQRLQRRQYNSIDQARADYLSQVDKLISEGYLDASAQ